MAFTSAPIDPKASPWHLLGSAIRHWRDDVRGLSLDRLGRLALVDASNLSKWERGERLAPLDCVERMDAALAAGGQLVAIRTAVVAMDRLRTLNGESDHGEESVTERRRLLQIAAVSAGSTALGLTGEPVRQLLDLSLSQGFRELEDWELACADHLHALRTRPPAQVSADLMVDLLTLRRQIDESSPTEATELQRITAALAAVKANVLTRMGDHGSAIRWWFTARTAADAHGDRALRVLMRAEEAGHGLYGQRNPQTVLRLVSNAERIAGGPTVDLLTTQAKALSMVGRHEDARTAIHRLLDLATQGVTPDRMGFWSPNQIHFAESWVHSATGDEARAEAAGEKVLRTTRDYQYRANIKLHQALCIVAKGGTDEGARHAISVINSLPHAYLSQHVIETGRLVLHAVPMEQHTRPAVMELQRELQKAPTTT